MNANNGFILYNNDEQWMTYADNNVVIKQLYSSYDLAYGNVLVSGLGFGILALWLCSKPEVKSVTVVEISEDIIKLFKDSNSVPDKLSIINENMIDYNTDQEYDVLLLDHYEKQNPDWILEDMKKVSSRIKHTNFWAWPIEAIYLFKMYSDEDYASLYDIFNKYGSDKDFTTHWIDFVDKFFPEETMLKNIDTDKLNYYIYVFFNQK